MADSSGNKKRKTKKRPVLDHTFYLDGNLHRKLHVNRPKDIIKTWNYPAGKIMVYTYSDVLKRHEKAFPPKRVKEMIGRASHSHVLSRAINEGHITPPQFSYSLDEKRRLRSYFWNEQNIIDLVEWLSTVHRGRPRLDGEITPQKMPTIREIKAMIHDEQVMYVKQGDTFVPTWRAKNI